MSYTKKEFITSAFEEIGLADYEYDLQPEEYQSALRKLDSMIASWNSLGVTLGYPLPAKPSDSNLNQDTTVPDSANEAIVTNLAMRLAPLFGKQVSTDTKVIAKSTFENLTRIASVPQEMDYNTTIAGAGYKGVTQNNNIFLGTKNTF